MVGKCSEEMNVVGREARSPEDLQTDPGLGSTDGSREGVWDTAWSCMLGRPELKAARQPMPLSHPDSPCLSRVRTVGVAC